MTTAIGYFASDNTLSDRGNVVTTTKKQPRGKEIIALIRNTIINLCREKYNASVEVDGIICICPVGTSSNHIVKIHQTILPADDVPYTDYVAPEQLLERPPDKDQGWPHSMDVNLPVPQPTDSEVPPVRKKRKYTRHKKLKTAAERETEKETPKTDNEDDVENYGEIDEDKNGQDDVSSAKKLKYPLLVHTLCGDDGMYLETSRPQVSVENVSGGEDIPISDNERQNQIQENTGKSAVASLLSNLMIPTQQVTQPMSDTKEQENTISQSTLDGDNITRGQKSVNVMELSAEESKVSELTESKPAVPESVDGVTNLPAGIVIKEEPRWEQSEDTLRAEYPYTPSHYLHDSVQQTSEANPDSAETENSSHSDEQHQTSDIRIKDEKPDSDSEHMEVDRYRVASSVVSEMIEKPLSLEDTTSSILMKILKGKSLREAYKSAGRSPKGPAVEQVKVKKEPNAELDEKISSPSEEESLVNRLPYASFAELFPGSSQTMPFKSDGNEAGSQSMGKSVPSTQSYHAFDLLARSMLQKGDRRRSGGRYSTRLSSGRKNPVNYTEMLEPGSDLDFTDDDSGSVEKSDGDREYSPVTYMNVGATEDEGEYSENSKTTTDVEQQKSAKSQLCMLLQKKSARNQPYRSPQLITTPYSNTTQLMLFSCKICGCEFSTELERDQHEEEEQYSEFVKCPLCNGYFGDEASKRKHMRDRHQVCEKGTVSNTGKTNCLEAPRSSGMLTYHSTQCPMCFLFFGSELERDGHLVHSHNVTVVRDDNTFTTTAQ